MGSISKKALKLFRGRHSSDSFESAREHVEIPDDRLLEHIEEAMLTWNSSQASVVGHGDQAQNPESLQPNQDNDVLVLPNSNRIMPVSVVDLLAQQRASIEDAVSATSFEGSTIALSDNRDIIDRVTTPEGIDIPPSEGPREIPANEPALSIVPFKFALKLAPNLLVKKAPPVKPEKLQSHRPIAPPVDKTINRRMIADKRPREPVAANEAIADARHRQVPVSICSSEPLKVSNYAARLDSRASISIPQKGIILTRPKVNHRL